MNKDELEELKTVRRLNQMLCIFLTLKGLWDECEEFLEECSPPREKLN